MGYKQLRDADMSVGYQGGWCLKYVQDAYKTDHPYPTAMAAWNANYGGGNHPNEEPPLGITVAVYLSLGNVPAGHVAIRLSDGWAASSSLPGVHAKPFYYKTLAALIADYGKYNGGASYLGWSEYVGTVRVVEPQQVNANDDQIRQAYQEILERPADDGGLAHYRNYTVDFMRNDLLNSGERKTLLTNKQAQADAARIAQEKADAQARADAEAAAKAKAESEARQKALEQQAADEAKAKAEADARKKTIDEEAAKVLADNVENNLRRNKMNVSKFTPYAKAIVAFGGVVLLLAKALSDGVLSQDDIAEVVGAIGVAYGVWRVPNK